MASNGSFSRLSLTEEEPPLDRAGEVQDLLDGVQKLIVPYIRAADEDATTKASGHGLQVKGGGPRTVLVEHHPPEKLGPLLNLTIPDKGAGKDGLLETVEKVLQYSVNTWDQGFMDKLYGSTNAVGVVSELILAVLNTNVHVFQVSPVLTLVEKTVTKYLASLFGFTGHYSGGVSQPGGSASNSSAIVIARNTLFPETKTDGLGGRKFVLFTSAHGHYSVEKAAQMFGFGGSAVKSVPVDWQGRMKVDELDKMISKSKMDGETPFFVNATAGTTVLGSYDPFDEIAEVCKRHNLWMHVDGSWGGSVVFNEELKKSRLKGIENADSIAMTPHKIMQVPMTCSFLIGKDLRLFQKAMTLPAGYLFHSSSSDEFWDLADLTPQCGRRGESLKFYLSLHYYGLEYWSDFIGRAFDISRYFYSKIIKHPDMIVVPGSSPDGKEGTAEEPPCLQVCFYLAKGQHLSDDAEENSRRTEEIAKGLIYKGWMVDYAPGDKGKFFRVVVNGGTRRATIDGFIKALENALAAYT